MSPCRLCGKPIHFKYTITRNAEVFDICECPACGFQQRDLDEKEAYRFYDEGYYKGTSSFSYQDERAIEEASRIVWKDRIRRLRRLDKNSTGSGDYLDVGCAFGGLMQVAAESGYRVFGVEVSQYSGAYAAERFNKDRVFLGNIETMELPEDCFSAVTLIEVAEHLYNPVRAFSNLYRSMKDGGVLLVQTADMDGLQAKLAGKDYHYYLPGHVSCFTARNLKQLLKRTGFRKVRVIGGVEFGLLSKLRKSAKSFTQARDYLKWIRISWYHLISRVTWPVHLTSSMVIIAIK